MKTPCKNCLALTCTCRNEEHCKWEEDSIQMKSPISHMCNDLQPHKRLQRRFKNFLSNSPCATIKESQQEENANSPSTPCKAVTPDMRNPFRLNIKSLTTYSFSPSTFTITEKDAEEKRSFRWSIEDIAVMNPADIDETAFQENCFHEDSETEKEAQEAIELFFSKSHIVPSPWTPVSKLSTFSPLSSCSLVRHQAGSNKLKCSQSHSVSTQTMLTIPPNLDLMSLLRQYFTYEEKPQRDVLESSSNSAGLPNSSTSFRRCKLFTSDDDNACGIDGDDDVDSGLRNSSMSQEQNNNVYASKFNQDFNTWSPYSDNFSSSPKTPKRFSLSGSGAALSIGTPGISPICDTVGSKSLQGSRRNLEISMENAESCQECSNHEGQSSQQEDIQDSDEGQSIMMTSALELDFGTSSTTFDPPKQRNLGSEERTFGNWSNQKDTGYLTGSINSMPSMILPQATSYTQLRTTPVAELLGDCAISSKPDFSSNMSNVSCDMDECMVSIDQSKCIDACTLPLNFSNMPWKPNMFSTPSSQFEASNGQFK